jgi:5-methylthioadenosine/S-adenosylhomocysteine deaminase
MAILYRAEWLIPINAPPMRSGGLVVENGRIMAVGHAEQVRAQYPEAPVRDFGQAAILPGFINVHSHLELTAMRGLLEMPEFIPWLMKLTQARMKMSRDQLLDSARAGAAEAIRAGITTMADIGNSSVGFDALRESGQRGVFFQEIICFRDSERETQFNKLTAEVDRLRPQANDLLRVGVSPHAPYTVGADLFRQVTDYAQAEQLPMCIHTAESRAEEEFLLQGTGEFAKLYDKLGLAVKPPGLSAVQLLQRLGVLDVQPLLVHCVTVNDEDIKAIAGSGSKIAHCPKSNAKLAHGLAPLAKFRQAGVTVGLGTDSVASNNMYDLIDEARFCSLMHRAASRGEFFLSADEALRLATLGGAEALGIADHVGTLEAGKEADFIAVDFSHRHAQPVHDPAATIVFSCSGDDVVFTAVQGRVLFDAGPVCTVNGPVAQATLDQLAGKLDSGGKAMSLASGVFFLAKQTVGTALKNDCLGQAKGAAFSFILFFFPLLLFLVALLVVTEAITIFVEPVIDVLPQVLPQSTRALVNDYISAMIASRPTNLLVGAFVVMVWTGSGMMLTFIEGLNRAYRVPETRPAIREQLVAGGLVVLVGLPLVALALLMIFGSHIESWLSDRLHLTLSWVWTVLRWIVVLLVTTAMISIIYYIGPNRRQTWRGVVPGAVLATTMWITATAIFGGYVGRVGEYNLIYGGLGAAIILLIWMYLSSLAVLIGGEFNAVLDRWREVR